MVENKKILLIDDDFLTREVITEILLTENYKITSAVNGKEGLEKFSTEGPFQLVITDLNMPVMNGMELLIQVRKLNDDQPVIILTGNSEVQVAMEAINKGANDYLLKDENIASTITYSLNRVFEKQRLIAQNKKLMEDILQKNQALAVATEIAEIERKKADQLLLNMLPRKVAEELKEFGQVKPLNYESVTVMFADLVGFTKFAWKMQPQELVTKLNYIFEAFDNITAKGKIEKLKTIGDSYMCASGLPDVNKTHSIDICLAALKFQQAMEEVKVRLSGQGNEEWKLRIGVHTGSVTAGVIGKTKSAYDMWGDSVNVASRMESACEAGRVNISAATYELVKDFFICESRGELEIKNRGKMDMYFLNKIHPDLSVDASGREPGEKFFQKYKKII